MHTRLAWIVAGLGFSVALAALVAAAPGEKPKAAWEYKFVTSSAEPADPDANFSNGPNALGAAGWELVSATVSPNGQSSQYVLYYKRAK